LLEFRNNCRRLFNPLHNTYNIVTYNVVTYNVVTYNVVTYNVVTYNVVIYNVVTYNVVIYNVVRVEMYYEEPDDSVVEVRKLAIPRFYEEPVVVRYVWLINDGC
jgi:hypothetical protein